MNAGPVQIEILVEEPSAEATLQNLMPHIVGERNALWSIHPFFGRERLLTKLPSLLRVYKRRIAYEDLRIAVLIDKDRTDCHKLKENLERMVLEAGLRSKSAPDAEGAFHVVNRIAIEELEAWFFGDIGALKAAYSNIPQNLDRKAAFRDPDRISGGTWEALHRILKKAGHFGDHFPKVEVARAVSAHMDPSRNRSHSFNVFVRGIEALIA